MSAAALILIPLLPLLGFIINGLFGKYFPKFSGIFGTLLMAASLGLACNVAYEYFFVSGQVNGVYQAIYAFRYEWLPITEKLTVEIGALLDPISVMMLIVVTLISFMVHLYSNGYMKGESRFHIYYAFLGLFTFSMLMLVLSINILQMYIFWELVGLSSFLLIGFYYKKTSAVAAAKKAFIVTRFADMFFLIGILMISFIGESLDITTLISKLTTAGSISSPLTAGFLGLSVIGWALLFIFIGGAGKSAIFPLHVWLPDAMEGPTPVSALIHAATMVVAGVYLIARLFPLYAITAPFVLELIAYGGAFTAIFAAIIACTQFDIKRILAFSTMSQIGFMLFALGVSAWSDNSSVGFTASMFHLFTHAIFKALLFLGAGAIIHYLHSNDLRDMGGLRKAMPLTNIVFLIACLAIAGIPPFAGFFSKEMILAAAYQNNTLVFAVGFITSGLTAFYMFRLYYSIFWRDKENVVAREHAHSSWTMNLPLILLAIGALVAGLIPFENFVTYNGKTLEMHSHLNIAIPAVITVLIAIGVATLLYLKNNARPLRLVNSIIGLHNIIYRKFMVDELYLFFTKKVIFNLVARPAAWFDKTIVGGTVNAVAGLTLSVSKRSKFIQSGELQMYMMYFLAGIFIIVLIFIL